MSSCGTSTPRESMTPPPVATTNGNFSTGSGSGSGGSSSDGPSPLTVGTRFVKQYYKVLSTTPELIHRFYQPDSYLSHGQGSEPTQPALFKILSQSSPEGTTSSFKDRFFVPGIDTRCPIRFEFEHGAIDAQLSVNGGILLAVTGHIVYLMSNGDGESDAEENYSQLATLSRKAFVHTFFLGSLTVGAKRSYYVHNDILRFLQIGPENDVSQETRNNSAGGGSLSEVDSGIIATANQKATEAGMTSPGQANSLTTEGPGNGVVSTFDTERTVRDDAPGGGVEESKEPLLQEEESTGDKTSDVDSPDKIPSGQRKDLNGIVLTNNDPAGSETNIEDSVRETGSVEKLGVVFTGQDDDAPPVAASIAGSTTNDVAPAKHQHSFSSPALKPTPGSWASLVAGGMGGSANASATLVASTPRTPTRSKAISGSGTCSLPIAPSTVSASTGGDRIVDGSRVHGVASGSSGRSSKRGDPDCTLVIKNIDLNVTESDVIHLFEPYGINTDSKIVGITVSAHRGIAFVDYDTSAPVLLAVEHHQKESFQLHGRILEVYQKTVEQRRPRNQGGRGGYRGGQPGNGSTYRGGGNRQPYRRSSGGRGDRGGRSGRSGR